MILIGMFDSPFVRRVAISLKLLGIDFEHRNWSVGKDQAAIREYNPLGRVPCLVLDDGTALVESFAILDTIDQGVDAERALLPRDGLARRDALQLMSLASGACEKGVLQLYESAFRPEEKRHEPWLQRCAEQMHGSLGLLDGHCARASGWLLAGRLSQADISVATAYTFLHDALGFDARRYPALHDHAQRCEALPAFIETRTPFYRPQPAAS